MLDSFTKMKIKHPTNLAIGHINVNSIRHKFDYLQTVLSKGLIDILCITETKLDDSFSPQLFQCVGFRCYRKDRNAKSGGMLIYVREDIPHNRLTLYEINDPENHIECVVLKIEIKKLSFNLTCLYKNPKVSSKVFIDRVSTMLSKLSAGSDENLILGDVNIDMNVKNNVVESNICDIFCMKNIIKSSTCFKSEKGTLIDPVIVSNTSKFCAPFNISCGVSDWHNIVGCLTKISYEIKKPQKIRYRSYKSFNEPSFKNDISQIPRQVCEVFEDIDDQYWAFNYMYKEVLDEHAPIKERTVVNDKIPYMHSDLRKEMYKRSKLKNSYMKIRTPQTWEKYRKQRNRVTSMRKKAIKSYFSKKCVDAKSPKDFWNCVKPFFATKCGKNGSQIILKENDTIVNDAVDVASVLNDHFVNIAHDIADTQLDSRDLSTVIHHHRTHSSVISINNEKHCDLTFEFTEVTQETMIRKLRGIKANKASGCDLIKPSTVKLCAKELAAPLTCVVNNAFRTNSFPNDMKKAEVCPVFKKKDPMCKDNYRPINLVTVFSKIFESIIAEQITDFMSQHLSSKLGAYRKGHGCSQILTLATNSWKWSLDNNLIVGALLMDLSKAFDSIPHDLLVCKLYSYGFSKDACAFMISYLCNRMQRVKIRNVYSEWKPTKRGIPQGSCLGPLLFNIYVNDMFSCIKQSELFNYADDNTLSYSNQDIDVLMETIVNDTKRLMDWFNANFMKVNPDKFQMILMKPKGNGTELPKEMEFENYNIKTSQMVTLLGIKIDNELTFDEHVKHLCQKASRQLKVMYRFKNLLGSREKCILFKTFIISNFNFCPVVWTFCHVSSIRKLEKVQERALRFLTDDMHSEYNVLLRKTNNISLLLSRMKSIAIEVFKSVHNLNPEFLNELFELNKCKYGLRDPFRLIPPKFNTIKYGKQSFSYYGSHIWNSLPNEYKLCVDFNGFKELINKWDGPKCSCCMCAIVV